MNPREPGAPTINNIPSIVKAVDDVPISSTDKLIIEGILDKKGTFSIPKYFDGSTLEVQQSDFSIEDVKTLCGIKGLTLNLTKLPDELKSKIEKVAGSLMDNSGNPSYRSLTTIGGNAQFRKLIDATGLTSLTTIGGDAYFRSLTDATSLSSLSIIGGNVDFLCLTNSRGLTSLATIGGNVDFLSLTDATSLSSLSTIGGDADFDGLDGSVSGCARGSRDAGSAK